ncbi:MAG: isoprenylcysteine carboxylmethyltransferase family protein [Pirellulaceae bacterium]|nr:isoprenylcysteine carboxylmethyltransferase family protein [Pirellulaceae bacterium]
MTGDDTVRLMLLLIGLVFVPPALYYRLRSFTRERLDRWQEGAFILFGLRLTALVMFSGGMMWWINPAWMVWSSLSLPMWLRCVGLAVLVIGGSLIVWTFHNLGKNLTDTVVTRQEHSLVTSGPYRWVRHPFYLAGALGVLGVCLATANWFFAVAGAVVLTFLYSRTRIEEAKLVERFGDDYRNYMQRVGRFLPRLRS